MRKILIGHIITLSMIFASESFSHKNWQVVCDNTNTCRMAGYTESTIDDKYLPISILFEREAGANSQIMGHVQVGDSFDDDINLRNNSLKMTIDHKTYNIDISQKLPKIQTDILINALIKEKQIRFTYGDTYKWNFSQEGSFAVMLKMDDYQKRIGTVGAIYKQGYYNEDHVLQSKPMPIINAPQIYSNIKGNRALPEMTLSDKNKRLLQQLLRKYYGEGEESECWMDAEIANESLKIYRLTDKVAIASQPCWRAAYNYADAFWLINIKPPFEPSFITSATDLFINDDGTLRIYISYKGRGIGDCWGSDEWIWNGEKFVETIHTTTGLCRGFPGGAWNLPTLVTKVKVQNISQ